MQDNSDISESRHLPIGAKAKATVRIHDSMQSTSYSDISPVTAFAAFGLFWTLLSIRVLMLWVFSSEFQPAPILPSDKPTGAELIALNLFQYQSVILACAMVIFFVIAPWYADPLPSRARHPSDFDKEDIWLDARLMLGAVFCMFTDSYLNAYDYVFAWNAHAVNFGSWAKFMPFAQQSASSRYGVGILWVIPVYMYFCCGSKLIGGRVASHLRKRFPWISITGTLATIWGFQFWLDFAVQTATLRLTGAYAFAKTYEPLTIFAGDRYQYPVYNSFSVACLNTAFSYIGLSGTRELGERISYIEKGYSKYPRQAHIYVRTLAIIGFCVLNTLICFTIPLTIFLVCWVIHMQNFLVTCFQVNEWLEEMCN